MFPNCIESNSCSITHSQEENVWKTPVFFESNKTKNSNKTKINNKKLNMTWWLGHVPSWWGRFWVHAHTVAHVRPWSKKCPQYQNLNEIKLSFLYHSILLMSWSFRCGRTSKSDEKWPNYGYLKFDQKWRPAHIGQIISNIGQIFYDMDFKFVLSSFALILMDRPILK